MNGTGIAAIAAVVYGAGDFFGGVASRRLGSFLTVACTQAIGLGGVLAILCAFPETPTGSAIGWGLATGAATALGIGCLYAALSVGRMSVVSPVSAVLGASLPVLLRVVAGERPSPSCIAGCVLALTAVVAVSAAPAREPGASLRAWLPATLASGLGFAAFYLTLARARPETILITIAVARFTNASVFALLIFFRREPRRSSAEPTGLALLILTAACDTGANVLYAAATQSGSLALAVVVTSLYPVSTAAAAYILLHERLNRTQRIGVASAIIGAALIARG